MLMPSFRYTARESVQRYQTEEEPQFEKSEGLFRAGDMTELHVK
jgi:hypothetical protein